MRNNKDLKFPGIKNFVILVLSFCEGGSDIIFCPLPLAAKRHNTWYNLFLSQKLISKTSAPVYWGYDHIRSIFFTIISKYYRFREFVFYFFFSYANGRGKGGRSIRFWIWIHKVLDKMVLCEKRPTCDRNFKKINPLRRAKWYSEEICKKK